MKKAVGICVLAMVLLMALPVGASAQAYALCNVEGCHDTQTHSHQGKLYAGHSLEDGHAYHQTCTVRRCTQTTAHVHDGVTCLPHSAGDGHGYHASTSQGTTGNTKHHGSTSGHRGGHH